MTRPPASPSYRFGQMTLVPDEGLLLKSGRPVPLTPKAFDLLAYMVAHAGRLLTKDEILRAVWPDVVVEESNLSYHVFAIRQALADDANGSAYIQTLPRRGYRFIAPVDRVDEPAARVGRRLALRRFQEPVSLPPAEPMAFSISPDSRHLLIATQGTEGAARFWVRTLSESDPRPLAGTEGFVMPPPIWSPDADEIAFANGGPLRRMSILGGVPRDLCDAPGVAVGGSWNRDGVILIGNPGGPLLRCSAEGGAVTPVTAVREPFEIHLMPSFLADGRHFLYLRVYRGAPERSGVYIGCIDGGAPDNEPRLLQTGFGAAYVPASPSGGAAVLFVRDRALIAQRFDDAHLKLCGEPVRLAENIGSFLDYAFFSASAEVVVYRAPDSDFQLTWFGRDGRVLRRIGAPEPVVGLALSPDGTRAVVGRHAPHNAADQDLWVFDVAGFGNPRRLTFAATLEQWPVWLSADVIAYGASGGERGIYQHAVDGGRRLWFEGGGSGGVTATPDMNAAVFVNGSAATRADLWVWTRQGPPQGVPLIVQAGDQTQAQLSPDARWLAYVSNESGRNEVMVAPFHHDADTGRTEVGRSVAVSNGGGLAPRWRGDGSELFYLTLDNAVMALRADRDAGVTAGTAVRLFGVEGAWPEWGVTDDGERFLLAVPTAPRPPLHILQDWQSAMPG